MTTMQERVGSLSVGLTSQPSRKPAPLRDWPAGTTRWDVTLTLAGRRFKTVFHLGPAHGSRQPSVAEVLEALASDAAGYLNAGSFEDWTSDYGVDINDSDAARREAERQYAAIGKQVARLQEFLGDAFDSVVWETMARTGEAIDEAVYHAPDCGAGCDGCGYIAADGLWYPGPCPPEDAPHQEARSGG